MSFKKEMEKKIGTVTNGKCWDHVAKVSQKTS